MCVPPRAQGPGPGAPRLPVWSGGVTAGVRSPSASGRECLGFVLGVSDEGAPAPIPRGVPLHRQDGVQGGCPGPPPPRPRHEPAHSGALRPFTKRTGFPPASGSRAGRGGVRSHPKAVCPGRAPAGVGAQLCGRCRPPPTHPRGGPRHTPALNAPDRSSASPCAFPAEAQLAGSSPWAGRTPAVHLPSPGAASCRGAGPAPEAPPVCRTGHTAGRDF